MRPPSRVQTAPNCSFKFHKRRQLFLRVRNETLSVATMRVHDPDYSLFTIQS
jgi:hypothetical protein